MREQTPTPQNEMELLERAWQFDNKPHLLFSFIGNLAAKHPDAAVGAEIKRLMDWAYSNIHSWQKAAEAHDALVAALRETERERDELRSGVKVILKAARGDEKRECWAIRKWMDQRNLFNGDIGASDRLIEEVCKFLVKLALVDPSGRTQEETKND